jgi:AcrR family transcriptional regulator
LADDFMARASGKKRTRRSSTLDVADQRRQQLLEAAYQLIAERGLEGLRTRDISARARVNISTLHYYFGTKEELLVAVVEHASSKFAARAAEPPSSPGGLRAHLEGAWRTFQSTPHLSTVLQELVLRGQRDPATRAAFRALHDGWNGIVEDLLRRQMKAGTARTDLEPRAAARIVTSFIMGAMVQLGVNPKAFDFLDVAGKLERWLEAGR